MGGGNPRLLHPDLRRVAPGADFAAGADLAHAAPDDGAGSEALELGAASAEGAAVSPVRFRVRVASTGLRFVHRAFAVPFPAQDGCAGNGAVLPADILRDEGDATAALHAGGAVTLEPAQVDDGFISLGDEVDIGAELVERVFECRPGVSLEGSAVGAS